MKQVRMMWRVFGGAAALLAVLCMAPVGPARAGGDRPSSDSVVRLSGDPGEYLTGGRAWMFSPARGDRLAAYTTTRGELRVDVRDSGGEDWAVELAGPGSIPLAVGEYPDAVRPAGRGQAPGLAVWAPGRACGRVNGSFTVTELVRGPHGYIERIAAVFRMTCDASPQVLTGEVRVVAPPMAELVLASVVDRTAVRSPGTGRSTFTGAVTCTKSVAVTVWAQARQTVGGELLRRPLSVTGDRGCRPGAPVKWSGSTAADFTPFADGRVEVEVTAAADDPDFLVRETARSRTIVTVAAVPPASVAALAGNAAPSVAHAVGRRLPPVAAGLLEFSGDRGDSVSLGRKWTYGVSAGDRWDAHHFLAGNAVKLDVSGRDSKSWTLVMRAASGQRLRVGRYADAVGGDVQGRPFLDLSGDGRACATTGEFTITELRLTAHGYVERLAADFTQRCNNSASALRGHVLIDNPPQPPDLTLGLSLTPSATFGDVSARAYLPVTVTCSKSTEVRLWAEVRQSREDNLPQLESDQVTIACRAGEPTRQVVEADVIRSPLLIAGPAKVTLHGHAADPDYAEVTIRSATTLPVLFEPVIEQRQPAPSRAPAAA
ncbi:hypothetical protein GCM10010124_41350 [Pilimelia terevasa]|uniref:Uncharacterized protein n=2 Tax=Pilimelia terevasa TaxID=53372 RepID=A0A8J3BUH2_9ACTN|nr:hypothetical protein GCM10010124_41350 [Pilimelia terevasa]